MRANIISDTFCTILITSNMFLEILSKFNLAFYYLLNTCLKIATWRSCCMSRNFYGIQCILFINFKLFFINSIFWNIYLIFVKLYSTPVKLPGFCGYEGWQNLSFCVFRIALINSILCNWEGGTDTFVGRVTVQLFSTVSLFNVLY